MTAQSFQLLEERLRTLRNGGVEIHHPVFEKTCPVNRKNKDDDQETLQRHHCRCLHDVQYWTASIDITTAVRLEHAEKWQLKRKRKILQGIEMTGHFYSSVCKWTSNRHNLESSWFQSVPTLAITRLTRIRWCTMAQSLSDAGHCPCPTRDD